MPGHDFEQLHHAHRLSFVAGSPGHKHVKLQQEDVLGQGEFAVVRKGWFAGVEVAVKQLHGAGEQDREDMIAEAQMLMVLSHPCVIRCYGIVDEPGSYSLVLQYMPGGSLRSKLSEMREKGTRLPLPELAELAYKTALGMAFLHRVRVVHFNLKCSSLLSFLDGTPAPCIKISDMRLARFKQDQVDLTNMRFGTKAWTAPEMLSVLVAAANPTTSKAAGAAAGAAESAAEQVDVYAYGITMFEMWTHGADPYPGKREDEIMWEVPGGLRPEVPADCDPQWAQLMQDCWHPDPAQRPEFEEIVKVLEKMVPE